MGGMLLARRLRRKFISNVHEKSCNQNQRNCNLSDSICSPKVVHFSNSFSMRVVNIKKTIPITSESVNPINSLVDLGNDIPGPIKGIARNAAEIFINRPDKDFSNGR